ncbi:acyl-CoA/acyl-ACP dehydrogenase [Pseudomonas sp. GD03842]|uniref:acyl-CoA dehydrogenase family protein n=1 Tax=unclassified Pseudomonas TaxID=196821 RepID=UPI000D3A9D4A|nr:MULTISPECIES: acyl-CoA dehydrogenase family protein [unclassified Pseudomonas]MDH0746058.1 acyl-CoA/acyl-ACP dehydrogenase [Pseudomonas sp. GD03842]RAU48523.1 acyl-CoA dehydrogenase [Pseudomonas sp. RIT 409]RAU54217.1 acyl-CoA dehydrogenase [Pseudomonas sp. RIT 412]
MNNIARALEPAERTADWGDDSQVLAEVRRIAMGPLAESVQRIDEGHYPLDIMASLAQAGAFAAHLTPQGQRFDVAVGSMHEASRSCGSTGFLMWCHDVCGLYMDQSDNTALLSRLALHTQGQTFGGTALSNPMKALAGIETLILRARTVPGGYRVNGALPWVSHINRGQYCGAIAGVERNDGSISHEIMFMLDLDERVELKTCPEFSGMEGTSTWGVRLVDYFVPQDALIADPARPFVQRIRGAFILLQSGMASGVAQGSIDSIREVEPTLGHVNQFLHNGADELQFELDDLNSRVLRLCRTPYETSKDFLLDVLDARVQGAELALKASQSALLHQGARGYRMSAAPQRRIREAHFVAIVTPAIKHLRWEMARLMKEEMPA